MLKPAFLTLVGLASIGLIACTVNSSPKPHESTQEKMSRLDVETKALIGSAKCTSDKQCHSIGFGDKPCGGFTSFRIYSDLNTDVTQLKAKVAQYNALSKQWNKDNNIISTCDYLIPPKLSCTQHTCQTQ